MGRPKALATESDVQLRKQKLVAKKVHFDSLQPALQDAVLADFLIHKRPAMGIRTIQRRFSKAALATKVLRGREKARARNIVPTIIFSTENGFSSSTSASSTTSDNAPALIGDEFMLVQMVTDDNADSIEINQRFKRYIHAAEFLPRISALFNGIIWRNIASYLRKKNMLALHEAIPFTAMKEIDWFYSETKRSDLVIREVKRRLGSSIASSISGRTRYQEVFYFHSYFIFLLTCDSGNQVDEATEFMAETLGIC